MEVCLLTRDVEVVQVALQLVNQELDGFEQASGGGGFVAVVPERVAQQAAQIVLQRLEGVEPLFDLAERLQIVRLLPRQFQAVPFDLLDGEAVCLACMRHLLLQVRLVLHHLRLERGVLPAQQANLEQVEQQEGQELVEQDAHRLGLCAGVDEVTSERVGVEGE